MIVFSSRKGLAAREWAAPKKERGFYATAGRKANFFMYFW
jgi:hypothetical protein